VWPIYAAKVGKPPEPKQFYADLITPGTLARKTFTSPHGLNVISKMNDPHVRAQAIVSFGGIGSAWRLQNFIPCSLTAARLMARLSSHEKPSNG
jgi:hypothetical protein